ncbi:MAG: ferrochelatase, partial [Cyanobacteriota bacterium]|nr:ferrochelatase [Cyanobacteriota bacterium]
VALQERLQQKGYDVQIYVGMRYWHPFTEEALVKIKRDKVDQLVVLPLYPQFSISTSGSSFRLLERLWEEDPALQDLNYTVIPSWYDRPGYLRAMSQLIAQELDHCDNSDQIHLFFSAHGVPLKYVEEAGDPYQTEIENCTQLIMETLDRPNPHTLAYQSRVGPVEWLKPYTEEAIPELAQQGVEDLMVVPISFVSEHIETLEEIDMEYRHLAEESGIKNFYRVPALNTHPVFIEDLADMVVEALDKPQIKFEDVARPSEKMKMYPQERWEWGMTTAAEVWNGRLAMLGIVAVVVELITGQGPLHMLGLL